MNIVKKIKLDENEELFIKTILQRLTGSEGWVEGEKEINIKKTKINYDIETNEYTIILPKKINEDNEIIEKKFIVSPSHNYNVSGTKIFIITKITVFEDEEIIL